MNRPPWPIRALLRALPPDFRERHATEMLDLARSYADGRGPAGRAWVWTRAGADIVKTGIGLRRRNRKARGAGAHDRSRAGASIALDVRHGLRSLGRDRRLTAFATMIVGLGIGATATVFSVVDALLLRSLPFADADRLVLISNGEWGRGQQLSAISTQVGYVRDLRAEAETLDGVAGFHLFDRAGDHTLTGGGTPRRLTRLRVTRDLLPILGVAPELGRLFTEHEAAVGASPVALLTHGFWERELGADASIVGEPIQIDDEPVTVVGVLPASFDFPSVFAPGSRVDYVTPFPLADETHRSGNTLAIVARLSAGRTVDAARTEVAAIATRRQDRVKAESQGRWSGWNDFHPVVTPLQEHVTGAFRSSLVVLAGACALVMLIVCANLSNLLLARGAAREQEFAVRAALGAGRPRLVRQLLAESIGLAGAGAVFGLALAAAGTRLLSRLDVGIPLLTEVRLDGVAIAFTVGVAAAAGLVFGIAPAVRASATRLFGMLGSARGTSGGERQAWARDALVVAEVGLACVLLIGATLLIRSFAHLLDTDLGFEPEGALAIRIDPTMDLPREERPAFYSEALRRVREVPAVTRAGLTDVLPTAFNRRWCARASETPDAPEAPCPYIRIVSEDYVPAMGLSLLAGRAFEAADRRESPLVAMVNTELAEALWPGRDAIGRSLRTNGTDYVVVGVLGGTRYLTPEQAPGPELFLALRQVSDYSAAHLVVRGAGDTGALLDAVRGALRPMRADLPLDVVVPISDLIERSLSPRRFVLLLLTGFAGFAVVLAALGIYGVIAYSVTRRTREIGIRIALGARRAGLQWQVVRRTLALAAIGLSIGLGAAWLLGRVLAGLLYGVAPRDPVTFAIVPAILLAVAAGAGFVPARRIARLDPIATLGGDTRTV